MAGMFGSSAPATSDIQAATGMRVQTSLLGLPVALMWGTVRAPVNVLWYGDFVASAQTADAGGKGGGAKTLTGYTYQAAIAMALGEGPIQDVLRVWVAKEVTSIASLALTLFKGTEDQAPWGYLTTFHPDQVLAYPGLSYLANGSYALGSSPDLSNHTMEVRAMFGGVTQPDANPSAVIADFLTNPRYGVPGFTLDMLDGLDAYAAYCDRQGLLISPLWSDRQSAADYVTHVLQITNTDAVSSQGRLRLIPRQSIAPSFAVDADELMAPVQRMSGSTSSSNEDAYNVVRIESLNRDYDYNVDPVTATDGVNIQQFGRRELSSITAHEFCDMGAAQRAAYLILQRGLWARQKYTLKLGVQRALSEPGDVGSIPYRGRAIDVRITETQREAEAITWTCEEYVDDGGDATGIDGAGGGAGYGTDYGTPPGPTTPPLFINAPSWLTGGRAQLWMAVSGTGNWGGVHIYISLDGTTYRRVGSTRLKARYGTLRAALDAPSADPDIVNTLQVQLVDATLPLAEATDTDALAQQTLCLLEGELVTYVHSTMVGAGQFDLTRLYRARKGTVAAAHGVAAPFLRIDGAVYRYTYDQALISSTVHVKLTAFNVFGGAEEDLSVATVYTVTLNPTPPPTTGTPPDYIPWDGGGGAGGGSGD